LSDFFLREYYPSIYFLYRVWYPQKKKVLNPYTYYICLMLIYFMSKKRLIYSIMIFYFIGIMTLEYFYRPNHPIQ